MIQPFRTTTALNNTGHSRRFAGLTAGILALSIVLVCAQNGLKVTSLFEKAGTRRDTRLNTLENFHNTLGAVDTSPWLILGPLSANEARMFESTRAKALTTPQNRQTQSSELDFHWRNAPFFDDQSKNIIASQVNDNDTVYFLGRRIIATKKMNATARIKTALPFVIYMNSAASGSYTNSSGHMANHEFPVKLETGTNTLIIKFTALPESRPSFRFNLITPVSTAVDAMNEWLDTEFPNADPKSYIITDIQVPDSAAEHPGRLASTAAGALLLSTRNGGIHRFHNNQWWHIASGLDEPLGLCAAPEGDIFTAQRPEITRLSDINGDGIIDDYQQICDFWNYTGHPFEWTVGPARAADGTLWFALSSWFFIGTNYPAPEFPGWNISRPETTNSLPAAAYRGWIIKATPDGKFTPWSCGVRFPGGLGIDPAGEVFVSDNQGEYVETDLIHHVTKTAFHGHPVGLLWNRNINENPFSLETNQLLNLRKPPTLFIPPGDSRGTISKPVFDTSNGKFGPFNGQLFIGVPSRGAVIRACLEFYNGAYQGACFPFITNLNSGVNRIEFSSTGALFVGQLTKTNASTETERFFLNKIIWTGQRPFAIHNIRKTSNGFLVNFTEPIMPPSNDSPPAQINLLSFNYDAEYSPSQSKPIKIRILESTLSKDARSLSLNIDNHPKSGIYKFLFNGITSESGESLDHNVAFFTSITE
ncbi:MAG: hypothetical protein K9N52_08530 [Verrucomicrobia bacterium]|nr:hypothetical protein [Verrucomicrobiota bacterium]